jgi:hypothetical protein
MSENHGSWLTCLDIFEAATVQKDAIMAGHFVLLRRMVELGRVVLAFARA